MNLYGFGRKNVLWQIPQQKLKKQKTIFLKHFQLHNSKKRNKYCTTKLKRQTKKQRIIDQCYIKQS